MRNSILCSAVILAASASTGVARAQSPAAAMLPAQITTSGSGETRMAPDRAMISIGVQTRAATAAGAGRDNAKRQSAVLDTLKALGLASAQLSTINYNVSPEMQYTPNGAAPPKVVGYTVSNTVRADVHRLDDVGRIIDAVLAKGANEISGLEFYSSKADSARRVSLGLAVMNARADAEALARAAGGSLGPLLELSTSEAPGRPIQPMVMRAATAKTTPVEAGEQSFVASVTGRWAFLPGR